MARLSGGRDATLAGGAILIGTFALVLAMTAPPVLAQGPLQSGWSEFFARDPVAAPTQRRVERRLPGVSTVEIHGDRSLFDVNKAYHYDIGQLVLGGEINRDLDTAAVSGAGASIEDTRHLRARIGFNAGAFLPYAVLGYSWQDTTAPTRRRREEGATFGIGAAYQVNDWFVVGTELVNSDLATRSGYGLSDQLKTTLQFSFEF